MELQPTPEQPILEAKTPSPQAIQFTDKLDKLEYLFNKGEQQIMQELKKAEDAYVAIQQQLAQATNNRIALKAQLSVLQQFKFHFNAPLNSNANIDPAK